MGEVTGTMKFILAIAAGGVGIVAALFLWEVWEFVKEHLDVK